MNFPKAKAWMWDYCIYLGEYTTIDGVKCDLGVHIQKETGRLSDATVWGNDAGNYSSGELRHHNFEPYDLRITEILKRYEEYKKTKK